MTNEQRDEQRKAFLKSQIDAHLVDVDFTINAITEDAKQLADVDPTEAFAILVAEVRDEFKDRPDYLAELVTRWALRDAAKK